MSARTQTAGAVRDGRKFPPKSLRELLRGMAEVGRRDEREIRGISMDSRSIGAGELFIALPGGAHDGRDHIQDALAGGAAAVAREASAGAAPRARRRRSEAAPRGAASARGAPSFDIPDLRRHVGAIAARFYDHPSANMRLIGITGTNGKTTCAYLLAQALGALGRRCALVGTLGAGFAGALRPGELTTPGAADTQRILAELRAESAEDVCLETSSHALAQGRVNCVEFDIALLTNLSRDHLDYHGDMRSYARAKEILFRCERLGAAVINIDDPFGRELLRRHRAASCLRYGMRSGDVRAHKVRLSDRGIEMELEHTALGRRAQLRSRLLGALNAPNLLAAAAVLVACGFALGEAADALGECAPPPGRMELWRAENTPGVVVDYAHTPDALARALESLGALCRGRLWVVFGCGGDRDRGKRARMGAAAEAFAARVIVTDDNPRNEDPAQIAAQIAAGMSAPPVIIHDRRRAIHAALAAAAPDDMVLVAGKGHETAQNRGARVVRFSDREVVRDALGIAEGRA